MEFLSNGLHQLYTDLDEDFYYWDDNNNNVMISNYNEFNNNNNNNNINNGDYEIQTKLSSESGKMFEPFQCDESNNSLNYLSDDLFLETVWETELLDQLLEIPSKTISLPERTPLCNDSCNIFLKESSDNLIKYQPSINFENDKMLQCNFGNCSKTYAKPAHLKAHMRRHLGDKPYICTWPNCTWKFSRSDELARHRRSHSGIKPYKCVFCSKCFARSDHLAKHRKVHERKMLAIKTKGIPIMNIHHRIRPGRKSKAEINAQDF